jgi:hypothetical protein
MLILFPAAGQTRVHDVIKGDTFEEIEGRGLVVRTEPDQAKVFIDGMERGLSPLTLNSISGGVHVIRITKDGYGDRVFQVTIPASGRLVVSIELKETTGQVLVSFKRGENSPPPALYPFEPEITIDGTSVSYTEGKTVVLPAGYRTIKVRAFGWEDASVTVFVRDGFLINADLVLNPAPFLVSGAALSRTRFNPGNSGSLGTTALNFEVSAPGTAKIRVRDQNGETVYTAELPRFTARLQSAVWSGKTADGRPLPDGVYTIAMEAESLPWDDSPPLSQAVSLEVLIDSSLDIYPLSLAGGVPGLINTASPAVLPPGSFQVEGTLRFGSVTEYGGAFSSLPFEAAARFSAMEKLEIGAALLAIPVFDFKAVWGLGASAKWLFFRSPLELAAGLSFVWSEEPSLSPQDEGLSLYVPLACNFGAFSLLFSPGLRWAFFKETEVSVFLPLGFLYKWEYIAAGLSLRPGIELWNKEPGTDLFTLRLGAEVKFYPPPSSLVYTLFGGVWFGGQAAGGFGGAAIGIIY